MSSWSDIEVELIVADYFSMLNYQSLGISYKKSEHRKRLLPLLQGRSEGSIEFKHQNISAVLISLGQPYVKGYLPRKNFQKVLVNKVVEFLNQNKSIEDSFKLFADHEPDKLPSLDKFDHLLVDPPPMDQLNEPSNPIYSGNPIKTNYLEREQRNMKLGLLGEEFVMEYEKWSLTKQGKGKLAKEIIWISQEEGDGAGYDILSKHLDGSDKYVEVKTTRLGKETPFFFSGRELDFSKANHEQYHLFRLFDFDHKVQMFTKQGALDVICNSTPVSYRGFF